MCKSPYRDERGAELREGDTVIAKTLEGQIMGTVVYCNDVGGWSIQITHKYSRYTGQWRDVQGMPATEYSFLTGSGRKKRFSRRLRGVELFSRPIPGSRRRNYTPI